jgi:hypothetical protein
MESVSVIIEIRGGIPEIVGIAAPRDVKVGVIIRDYDIEGADPGDLTFDPSGVPCFESGADTDSPSANLGFV